MRSLSRFRTPFSTALAISVGLLVLLGYFVDLDLLSALRRILLNWGVALAGVALVVGIANLFTIHWRKFSSGEQGSGFSLILILSLVFTILTVGYFGPTAPWSMWIFNYIQVPIESSLMAILAVTLAYASVRLLRRRPNGFSIVFVVVLLMMLLGTAPLLGVEVPGLYGPQSLRAFIASVPAVAGARGILFGVALGTVATGLRVLMGVDRPYGG